ncbi:MAG: conjugal transfer protein [Atopobiaceae bacterium]|nr:conjugal transfer protein [Atopobiaceae bacterium]
MATDAKGEFIRCPRCGQKTRTKVLPGTVLVEFPLFCPKCKRELVVSFRRGVLTRQEPVT